MSAVVAVFAVPIAFGLWQVQGTLNPSNLGVFSTFMGSPIQLVLPLLAAGIGCVRLHQDLGDRFVANLRTRLPVERYLRDTAARAILAPLVAFGGSVLVAGVIAFAVWPLIGNPFLDPSVYHLEPGAPQWPDLARFTYSEAMVGGWPLYLVLYALLFGLSGALFSAAAAFTLLMVARRTVALLIPWGLYLLETLGAALVGVPHAGLMYAIVPFGLQAAPAALAVLPIAALAVAVVSAWVWLWSRRFEIVKLR